MIVLIGCLFKSYRYLQVLQLEHYYNDRYLLYLKRNYLYYNLIPLICLLGMFFNNIILNCILVSFYLIFLSVSTIPSVVKLKFTNRILRIYLCIILLLCTLCFIPYVFQIIFFLLFDFLLLIGVFINKPIDKYINNKYLNLSKSKLEKFNGIKIGITGSYGKTSTKNIINDILKQKLLGSCSYKSYNTVLGISKYLNDITIDLYDYLIFEFGASHVGDIKELVEHYNIDIACVTEIGYMHLDTFKSIENIIDEKMSICDNAKVCILNYENEYIRNYNTQKEVISYGFNYGDYRALNIVSSSDGASFDLYHLDKFIDNFSVGLLGSHQILNTLCAIAIARYLSFSYDEIKKYLLNVSSISHRLNLIKYDKFQMLDDSYNANIKGSISALNVLNSISKYKVMITPGFVEQDLVLESLYQEFAEKIINTNVTVILSSDYQTKILQEILDGYKYPYIVFDSFKESFDYFKDNFIDHYYTLLVENDLPDNYKKV